MTNLEIAHEISNHALSYFGNNLSAVLLYGSTVSARQIPNDLDIIIVLKQRETPEDLRFLSLKKESYGIEIDLQVINVVDVHPETFSHDTHGQFVIGFLKEAMVLYGENPFIKLECTFSQKCTSVIQKCQYYYFRAKKVQANTPHPNVLGDISFHRKKLFLMLADFWYVYSGIVIVFPKREDLSEIISCCTGTLPDERDVLFLLGEITDYTWGEIFNLYQKYYFGIIDVLDKRSSLSKEYVGHMYVERYVTGSKMLAVIAPGLPSDYDESDLISFLKIRGYDAVLFHYSSTGKSLGNSFIHPSEDVADIVRYYAPLYEKTILVGNSYGGYAALGALSKVDTCISFTVLISPVYDFGSVLGIETLPSYLSKSQGGWYRFPASSLSDFIGISGPVRLVNAKNIVYIQATNDAEISSEGSLAYCKQYDITYVEITNKHLSYRRFVQEHVDVLHRFI